MKAMSILKRKENKENEGKNKYCSKGTYKNFMAQLTHGSLSAAISDPFAFLS